MKLTRYSEEQIIGILTEHEAGAKCADLCRKHGMPEGFVKTLKRDYVRVNPLPDAETVLRLIGDWIEDYNDNHPHSGLKWRSPREFIKAKTETA